MNKITLNKLLPFAIQDRISDQTEIWNKDLSFEKGIFYLIQAVSGSGKSTFINSLYGTRKDYQGDILFDKQSITDFTSDDFSPYRKNQLSIIFQDLRLFGQLSAKENILIQSNQRELSAEQEAWIDLLNIRHVLNNACQFLSYGERQRVAIIRALSQEFDFLLADEPFSHLDKQNAQTAYKLLLEKCQNKTLIMTSLGKEDYLEADQTLFL